MNQFYCIDRYLPDALNAPAGASRLALIRAKKWQAGEILDVLFMGGTGTQQAKVQAAALEVADYANIVFRFSGSPKSVIRISFDSRGGAWSMLGTDCRGVSKNQPTMNLGFDEPPTYVHEILHALGAIHEHQNPFGETIKWNEPAVIRDLSGPPNNWDAETIRHNIFEQYAREQLNGSVLDPSSVMMYPIKREWTLNGFSAQPNPTLSVLDKQWLATEYPGKVQPPLPPPTDPSNPCAGLLACWQLLQPAERLEVIRQSGELVRTVSKIGQLFTT